MGAFQFGGTGSKVLRVCNFASTLLSSAVVGSLSGNALFPWRYCSWQRFWCRSSHSRECEVIGHVVFHVSDTDKFEAALVRPKNLITSWSDDSYLPDL